ncbi:hypothetical protein Bca4012_010079 [Brassica carinata]
MSGLACNSCNKEFEDDAEQKLHYKSEWHHYKFKRKSSYDSLLVFLELQKLCLKLDKLRSLRRGSNPVKHLCFTCGVCDKAYRSSKAREQHLKSKSQFCKASSQGEEEDQAIINQLPPPRRCVERKEPAPIEEESEEEWVEVDSDEDLEGEDMDESGSGEDMEEDDIEFELDPTCCLM